MPGVIEIGSRILTRSRLDSEISAQNMTNMLTPGYKALRLFSDVILSETITRDAYSEAVDLSFGKVTNTGSPLDLAIVGNGFFTVKAGDRVLYTRNGQFSRDPDGRIVTAQGHALQSRSGDVITQSADIVVNADGTILEGGTAIGRLSIAHVADPADIRSVGGGLFEMAPGKVDELASPKVQQGAIEASNVSSASEMLSLMGALRRAESGQRLIQTYDDLMGKVVTAFGQS